MDYWKKRYQYLLKCQQTIFECFMMVSIIATVGIIVSIYLAVSYGNYVDSATNQIEQLKEENQNLKNEISNLSLKESTAVDKYNDLATDYNKMTEINKTLDSQNQELISDSKEKDEKIQKYEARAELFDSYEYALIRNGKRTDITYDDIQTLQNLISSKGMSEDSLDVVLAISMIESGGQQSAYNSSSGAAGLGGILPSTGRYVWNTLMGESTPYSSTIALNGKDNLEIMLYYLDYLSDYYGGNVDQTLNAYRGGNDSYYKATINSYLANNNKSLSTISF